MQTKINFLVALGLLLALTGCVRGVRQETPAPVPSAQPSSIPLMTPHIFIGLVTGVTTDEAAMIGEGASLVNKVLQSECFKSEVLKRTYTENKGMTPEQIYKLLSTSPVQVDVNMYLGSWAANHVYHTIGYEDEPGVVHMNRYFVKTAYMVADNLIHEGEGHSQGFSHYGVKESSVPYRMNQIFEACAAEMAGKL